MTIENQDALLGKLTRERNDLKRELAGIDAQIASYAEAIAELSGELIHDKHRALATLGNLDVEQLKRLLKDYAEVSSKLRDRSGRITEMGG